MMLFAYLLAMFLLGDPYTNMGGCFLMIWAIFFTTIITLNQLHYLNASVAFAFGFASSTTS